MIALLLFGVLVFNPAAQHNPRVLLREAYAVGDIAEVRNEVTIHLKIETRGARPEVIKAIHRELYRSEISEVDPNGAVRGFRRTYLRHRTDISNGKVEVSSLEGKSVEAAIAGKDIRVKSTGGALAPEAVAELRNQLTLSRMSLAPNRIVAPGDSWTVDPKLTARIFPGADKVSIHASLAGISSNGRARILLQLEARGKLSISPVAVIINASGSAEHAVHDHRPIGMTVRGPFSAQGTVMINGKSVPVRVSGSVSGISHTRWIKTGK